MSRGWCQGGARWSPVREDRLGDAGKVTGECPGYLADWRVDLGVGAGVGAGQA